MMNIFWNLHEPLKLREENQIIISKQINDHSKQFLLTTYDQFQQMYSKMDKCFKHYDEVKLDNTPCFFVVDIDASSKQTPATDDEFVTIVQDYLSIVQTVADPYKINIADDFVVLTACGNVTGNPGLRKFSYHIINRKLKFKNCNDMAVFVLSINKLITTLTLRALQKRKGLEHRIRFFKLSGNTMSLIVDEGLYTPNHSLRLFGSIKTSDVGNESRRLSYFDMKTRKRIEDHPVPLHHTMFHGAVIDKDTPCLENLFPDDSVEKLTAQIRQDCVLILHKVRLGDNPDDSGETDADCVAVDLSVQPPPSKRPKLEFASVAFEKLEDYEDILEQILTEYPQDAPDKRMPIKIRKVRRSDHLLSVRTDNVYCSIAKKVHVTHTSGRFFIFDTRAGTYWQKCMSTDCRPERSKTYNIPPEYYEKLKKVL